MPPVRARFLNKADAFGRLVTHQLPLDEIEQAFELASQKQSGAIKVSVLPDPDATARETRAP